MHSRITTVKLHLAASVALALASMTPSAASAQSTLLQAPRPSSSVSVIAHAATHAPTNRPSASAAIERADSVAALRQRNTIIGGVIGGVIGAAAGFVYARSHPPTCGTTPGGFCAYGPDHRTAYRIGGTAVGVVLGAMIGHLYPQTRSQATPSRP